MSHFNCKKHQNFFFIQNREKLSKSELERHKRHLTILSRLQSQFKPEDNTYFLISLHFQNFEFSRQKLQRFPL